MTPQQRYEAHRAAYREAYGLPTKKARGRLNYTAWLRSKPTTQEAATTPAPGDVAQQNPLQGPTHDR